jgi:phosphatidylglycerophosphate synthase
MENSAEGIKKNDDRWLQNITNRFLAFLLVRLIAKSKIQPAYLTLFSLILGGTCALLLLQNLPLSRLFASIILFSSLILDSADGQLARLKKQISKKGDWFDKISDRIKENAILISITYFLEKQMPDNGKNIWLIGALAIFSVNFMYYNLSLLKTNFSPKIILPSFLNRHLFLRNLISFGYGERILYLSCLLAVNQPLAALWLVIIGCTFHIVLNSWWVLSQAGQGD